jgi:L-fucose isomerase-like protein
MPMVSTFALYFGNRGFFPESLIASARAEMIRAFESSVNKYIIPDENMTRYGAVETRSEGVLYAQWLAQNKDKYDGVILCLPNFGDENGAVAALRACGTPILIQAYPDEIGKMDFARRRDAYCGKFSIMDYFHQCRLPYTVFEPHVVHPLSETFRNNLNDFAAVCRIVKGMRNFSIGAIGARTTKFKTVRYDEIALQKYGITVETFDLSELFFRVEKYDDNNVKIVKREEELKNYSNFGNVPGNKMKTLAKVSVVIDDFISDYGLDCVTLRCWEEMQTVLGIAPCVLLGFLNNRGVVASCEIDLCSAINMHAMKLASGKATACLDWNNNYGENPDKVILFHCGPVAESLMEQKGRVTDHKMFAKANPGCGWGSDEGRIAAGDFTYSNCKTEDGKLTVYAGEGRFTGEPIEEEYFGCGGVAYIENLQPKLIKLGRNGFRHHTSVGVGHMKKPLLEAFSIYLGYDIMEL